MSDRGPGPGRFERPRWILPAALVGAALVLLGLVLAVDWTGGDDPPPQITTTTTEAG